MIGEWLGKLKTALNPPSPPYFMLDDELDELEEELPALARVLRSQQEQISRLDCRLSLRKSVAIAAIAFVVWFSWFFRYEPADNGMVVLDRWTGWVVRPYAKDKWSLSWKEPDWNAAKFGMDDLETAREAGYTDTATMNRLVSRWPQFDFSGARDAGYSDTEIIEELIAKHPQKGAK
jgi:hypothetical protein